MFSALTNNNWTTWFSRSKSRGNRMITSKEWYSSFQLRSRRSNLATKIWNTTSKIYRMRRKELRCSWMIRCIILHLTTSRLKIYRKFYYKRKILSSIYVIKKSISSKVYKN
jgi:hypothetical protein